MLLSILVSLGTAIPCHVMFNDVFMVMVMFVVIVKVVTTVVTVKKKNFFFFIGQVEAYTPHWQPHTHKDLYIATRRNVLSGLHEWSINSRKGWYFIVVLGFLAASGLLDTVCCDNSGGLRLSRSSHIHLVWEQILPRKRLG